MLSKRWICTSLMTLLTGALAIGTPAGTTITNSATLNFRTVLGDPQQVTSNPVNVLVTQVYAVSVTPNATENAIPSSRTFNAFPGQTVFIPYTISNDGNGTDTFNLSVIQPSTGDDFDFSNPNIYLDGDNDGTPDSNTPLTQIQLSADAKATLLVAAQPPAGAAASSIGKLSLQAASTGNNSVVDNDNYAQVVVSTAAQLNLSLSNNPQGPVAPGATIRYVAQGSNPSSAAAGGVTGVINVDGSPQTGILLRDILPAGLTVSSVDPSSGSSVGTSTVIYSTDGGVTWTATRPTGAINAIGLLITGTGNFFGPGATYRLDFTTTVAPGTAGGTPLNNQATLVFDGNQDGDGADPGENITSLTSNNTVANTYGAAFGPFGTPNGNGTGSYTFQNRLIDRNADTQTIQGTVTAGTTVSFKQTLLNTGNSTNTFNVTIVSAPSGWNCRILNVDGNDSTSPYSNPVSLNAGASIDLAAECDIPLDAPAGSNQEVRLTATPQNGGADSTSSFVAQVVAANPVVLGNSDGNPATPPSTTPVTVTTNPGTPASFRLEVQNGAPIPESYTLSGTVPAGYPAPVFYLDTNCDGTPEGAPITTTPSIPAGQTICLVAQVTPPNNQGAGSVPVQFTATSTTTPSRTSSITNTLQVAGVASITAGPNGAASTIPGGTVVYNHTITNTSNSAVTISVPPGSGCEDVMYWWGARVPSVRKCSERQEWQGQERHPDVSL
ncbi:hypothetical protein, DUF11 (plasmid) [Deinococcus geothermalis DSM 11300]|uniref:DUF11 domain-containing protein n=1 Tax=Deinococcus geothermalis (strain DSM 11300 / CIP 105573 / AG-3a) TaxID=319795 RepID=Q1J3R8_DEIGD|nr:hypothetical protein, DUF11 [Deinococcus geothermalis DSM 11300]